MYETHVFRRSRHSKLSKVVYLFLKGCQNKEIILAWRIFSPKYLETMFFFLIYFFFNFRRDKELGLASLEKCILYAYGS